MTSMVSVGTAPAQPTPSSPTQGTHGTMKFGSDFLSPNTGVTWAASSWSLDGGLAVYSVNEGSYTYLNEENGIVRFTTDTANDDNVFLVAGPFRLANQPIEVEYRFRPAADAAWFAGIMSDLNRNTPVLPVEEAGATITYRNDGVGLYHDPDQTTDAVKAVWFKQGVEVRKPVVYDDYWVKISGDYIVARVLLHRDGKSHVRAGSRGEMTEGVPEDAYNRAADAIRDDRLLYAVLGFENRTAGAKTLDVDYVWGSACRQYD